MGKNKLNKTSRIHLLDVGEAQYGDCLYCEVGDERILIDGGHEADLEGSADHLSIPNQLRVLAGISANQPTDLTLLIVSHAHADHVGCLPEMVKRGMITAEWALLVDPDLAWSTSDSDATSNRTAVRLLAALREEPRYDLTTTESFNSFADGATRLQGNYRQMIRTLKSQGTKVVLHGTSPLAPFEKRFAGIGMKVLGPSKGHIRACANRIQDGGRDFLRDATDALSDDDDAFEVYKALQEGWAQELDPVVALTATDTEATSDAVKSLGPVINLQSSAFVLDDGVHRFLFTGDAQLERPEVADPVIKDSITNIFRGIANHAPYDFVKLGHHGSDNAFGDTLLSSIGQETRNFGICTGANSKHHPSRRAIDLLKAREGDNTWARTDKNGAVTFTFSNGEATVSQSRGRLNDASVPSPDERPRSGPEHIAVGVTREVAVVLPSVGEMASESIEIRIPYVPGTPVEVSLTLRIAASGAASTIPPATPAPAPPIDTGRSLELNLGAGRDLPSLLFVTQPAKLAANIGFETVDQILAHVKGREHVLVEVPDIAGPKALASATAAVRSALQAYPHVKGVVILGGYDVLPAERRDAAPGASPAKRLLDQEDRYVVWSDAVYADTDQDGLAELPVSRIPDGKSAALMINALNAPAYTQLQRRHGLRNVNRPFADKIYQRLVGPATMLQSHPHPNGVPQYQVGGDHVYLMLHGDYDDATRFWGELDDGSPVEAVHIDQLRLDPGAIVFTGCCWGALPVLELASAASSGHPTPRTAADSIALRCLSQGVRAFVGCTGMHYSPQGQAIDKVSGPLHDGFWERIGQGQAPAQALFDAKVQYIAHPARANSYRDRKIFEQFTVLGLGW